MSAKTPLLSPSLFGEYIHTQAFIYRLYVHILHIPCIYTVYVQHEELYPRERMWTRVVYTHTIITLYNTLYIYVHT